MARYRRQRSNPSGLGVFDNPRIFGTDLRESVDGIGGIVLTAMFNDKVLSPLTRKFVQGFKNANHTVGQLIDAGTTLFAAQLVGMAGSKFLGAATGRRMAEAGGMYGAAKAVTAFVPSLSLSAQYPDYFPGLALFGGGAPAAANGAMALPAGSAAPGANYFTANPRPVAADADVGY